jgi:hypothetical protein
LADSPPMGVEPAIGNGPFPAPASATHDLHCTCPSGWTGSSYRPGFACTGLWARRGRHDLEGGSLLGPRFCLAARWHLALSRRANALGARAASSNWWKLACGLRCQHPQLPPLPSARAVSMVRQNNHEAGVRVSVLWHPLNIGSAPLLWRDWSRRRHRRAFLPLLRPHQVVVQREREPSACPAPALLSRAQRAHSRLDWPERLARNARIATAHQVSIKQIARSRTPCSLARVSDDLTAP